MHAGGCVPLLPALASVLESVLPELVSIVSTSERALRSVTCNACSSLALFGVLQPYQGLEASVGKEGHPRTWHEYSVMQLFCSKCGIGLDHLCV